MRIKLLIFLYMKSHQEIQEELRNQEKWQIFESKQPGVCQELLLKVLSTDFWNKSKLIQLSDVTQCIIWLTLFFAVILSLSFHIQNHIWTNFEVWDIYYEIPFTPQTYGFRCLEHKEKRWLLVPCILLYHQRWHLHDIGMSSKTGISHRDWTTYLLALQQCKWVDTVEIIAPRHLNIKVYMCCSSFQKLQVMDLNLELIHLVMWVRAFPSVVDFLGWGDFCFLLCSTYSCYAGRRCHSLTDSIQQLLLYGLCLSGKLELQLV